MLLGEMLRVAQRSFTSAAVRLAAGAVVIAALTFVFSRLIPVNPTTAGFLYLIAILIIAARWGLLESVVSSVLATVCFNFFFIPPVGTFTIADPSNWVALFAFLVTSLIASQLSERARRRTLEAVARQLEMERLWALSRAILLMETTRLIPREIAREIARIYELKAVAIYDRSSGQTNSSGLEDITDVQSRLYDTAARGTLMRDDETQTVFTSISLGGQSIGSLALRGSNLNDTALQALVSLVAIAVERARVQEAATRAEAARQSEEFKSTLLDAVAHEFKTPLTSIKAATSSMLFSGPSSPDQQRELLVVIDQEADRLSALVTEAIHLARVEAGKVRLNRQSHSVRALVDAALQQTESVLEGRTVRLSFPDDLPRVPLDGELMQLVVRHLLDNAAKYSFPNSPISIAASLSGESMVLSLRNEGEGIPEEEHSKIFEKFYRSANSSQQVPGTGMGLAIAREIVQAHGGDIRVESAAGQGTEFVILLPLVTTETPA